MDVLGGCAGRCGKMWEDVGRCGKVWGGVGRCGGGGGGRRRYGRCGHGGLGCFLWCWWCLLWGGGVWWGGWGAGVGGVGGVGSCVGRCGEVWG